MVRMAFLSTSTMAFILLAGASTLATSVALEASQPGVLQVVLPDSIVNSAVEQLLPTVIQKIDSTPLPTCCYDDVGVKHVHLNLQSMKVAKSALALKVASSPSGISMQGNASLTVTGSYRLCLHDDPFSKHACSTLYGCKGDFQILPSVSLDLMTSLGAEDGLPKVTITESKLHVNSMNSNLCGKFRDEISKNLAKIDEEGSKAVQTDGQAAIAKLLTEAMAKVDFHSLNFTSHRYVSNGTRTINSGIVVQGGLVLLDDATHQPAPWQPRYPLPTPPTAVNNTILVYVTDSLINNVIYPEFKAGILHASLNKTEDGIHWKLVFSAAGEGPSLQFNKTDQMLFIPLHLTATSSNFSFSTNFTAFVGFSLGVEVENGSTLVLKLQVKDDLGMTPLPSSCTDACRKIINALLLEARLAIPLADAILKNKSLSVDLPHTVSIEDLSVSYGEGFMEIAVQPSLASINVDVQHMSRWTGFIETAAQLFRDSLLGSTPLKCPEISGAHQDSCI